MHAYKIIIGGNLTAIVNVGTLIERTKRSNGLGPTDWGCPPGVCWGPGLVLLCVFILSNVTRPSLFCLITLSCLYYLMLRYVTKLLYFVS